MEMTGRGGIDEADEGVGEDEDAEEVKVRTN